MCSVLQAAVAAVTDSPGRTRQKWHTRTHIHTHTHTYTAAHTHMRAHTHTHAIKHTYTLEGRNHLGLPSRPIILVGHRNRHYVTKPLSELDSVQFAHCFHTLRIAHVDTAFYIHLAKWLTLTPDPSLSHIRGVFQFYYTIRMKKKNQISGSESFTRWLAPGSELGASWERAGVRGARRMLY